MGNPYQDKARYQKALAMAAVLSGLDCTPEMCERMSEEQWRQVEIVANVRPTSTETRALVAQLLADIISFQKS